MKGMLYVTLVFMFLAVGCEKSNVEMEKEDIKEEPQYFIRVKNISDNHYYNVRAIPVTPDYFHDYGPLGVGEISEYQPFTKSYFSVDVVVTVDEYDRRIGLHQLHIVGEEIKQLIPGKYRIDIRLYREYNNRLEIETKLIKED
ncbi:MAG TPA: hypothetical protein PKA53_02375 [Sphingobacterium sp.]|nr:hypothetical protein [Sphingobacterium sp.]